MYGIIESPCAIIAVSHSDTLEAAAAKMVEKRIGCLVVNNEAGEFSGLVTERDIVNAIAVNAMDLKTTTIAEIMTTRVVSCPPNTPVAKALETMASNHIRHLPIVERESLLGIVSIRDLMVQKLREDRAAAEEVAMLSTCLKSIDFSEVIHIVATEMPKLFQAERCVLLLHEPGSESEEPKLVDCNNCCWSDGCVPTDVLPSSDEKSFFHDCLPNFCQEAGAQAPRVVVPLRISSAKDSSETGPELSGCLCMCGLAPSIAANRELTSHKARLCRDMLNAHLSNAKLYQDARLTSMTDALTGVGSRKFLEDKLEDEYARSRRYKHPLSVAMIDLDNFKMINDVLGHAGGDEALIKLASCIVSQKRYPDQVARYGGDEFVILMPETVAEDARKLLERLRAAVREIEIAQDVSMTISCGVAHILPEEAHSLGELIRRADLALYEAKSAGRNCVKIWDTNMSKQLDETNIEIEKVKKLQRRVAGLSEKSERMFIQSIWSLVQALEAKDAYIKQHSENVTSYAISIAKAMKVATRQIEVIRWAAMLHDIGKIGIPDAIVSKPGQLTPRERTIIEQHPLIAARILSKMSFLEMEIRIIRHHHEKWNGEGYPDGLSDTSIPIGARILAVADTFDALTSHRAYHKSRPVSEAVKIMKDAAGYDFDPDVIQAMVSWIDEVHEQLNEPREITTTDLLNSEAIVSEAAVCSIT